MILVRCSILPLIVVSVRILVVTATNALKDAQMLTKISGTYNPGYIYGNPKTHRDLLDPLLRPIISQVETVTHDLAKHLNNIIVPYMPQKYMLSSTYEFIQISQTINSPKLLGSLVVEILFSNMPVSETIVIILDSA